MNGLQMLSQTESKYEPGAKNKLRIIFPSHKDGGAEQWSNAQRQTSAAMFTTSNHPSPTQISLLPQDAPYIIKLFPSSLWHNPLVQERDLHGNNHQPCKRLKGKNEGEKSSKDLSLHAL